jgi:hypothetical protein
MCARRLESRLTDDECQLEAAVTDQHAVALSAEEAARFLDALETVDDDTVARLRDLRLRARGPR